MAGNLSKADWFGRAKPHVPAVLLLAIIVLISFIRIRLLQVPLERDEGEYAYIGQLILGGIPPYSHAYSLKLPGMFYAYAFIMLVFGQTIEAIRVGLLIVNVVTILLLFLIAKHMFDQHAGIAASASYAVLSLSPAVLGMFSHATHFVMVFVLSGLLIFLKIIKKDRPPIHYLFCGLFFGIGFAMKQHAVFFLVFPLAYLFMSNIMGKQSFKIIFMRSIYYLLGTAIPLTAICLYLYAYGVFDKFWFWTFDYAREYVSEIPIEIGVKRFVSHTFNILKPSIFLWLLAGIGLLSLLLQKSFKNDRFFILCYLVFSVLSIFPGFYFREHYYIMLLPAISLLIGISVRAIIMCCDKYNLNSFPKYIPLIIIISAISYSIYYDRGILIFEAPENVSRNIYGNNPFVESLPIAKYIEENSSLNDRILVLGSEPQIYFYSRRLSATGHIYMYGLMEKQKYARSMQQEMIREIVSANPEIIVVVTMMDSWQIMPYSDTTILDWANRYAAENFELVGIADKIGSEHTTFLWGKDAVQYSPQSNSIIYLFKRRLI